VAELADAHGSGPCPRKWVGVQLPPAAIQREQGAERAADVALPLGVVVDGLAERYLYRYAD
jgi:hypothetical protein